MPGLRDIPLRKLLDAATGTNDAERVRAQIWLKENAPELAALCLDMGERISRLPCKCGDGYTVDVEKAGLNWRAVSEPYPLPPCERCALLARLDRLGKEPSDG